MCAVSNNSWEIYRLITVIVVNPWILTQQYFPLETVLVKWKKRDYLEQYLINKIALFQNLYFALVETTWKNYISKQFLLMFTQNNIQIDSSVVCNVPYCQVKVSFTQTRILNFFIFFLSCQTNWRRKLFNYCHVLLNSRKCITSSKCCFLSCIKPVIYSETGRLI